MNKQSPPPAAIRGGNWQAASRQLQGQLKALDAQQARDRARQEYTDAVLKPETRSALSSEQGNLCAFCESRVSAAAALDAQGQQQREAIRVAHWTPIDAEPTLAVTWANLFASCALRDTCDDAQRNRNPEMATVAKRDWSLLLDFETSGAVTPRSGAPRELARAIGERQADGWQRGIWNLNHEVLRTARKTAIQIELQQARAARDKRAVSKTIVIDERLEALSSNPQPYQSALLQALSRWR